MARARGRGRGRGAAAGGGAGRGGAAKGRAAPKRKAKEEDSPPPKLKREDSTNTQLRRAINEAKEAKGDDEAKKFKCDAWVISSHPKATIHQDYTCMLNQTNIGHNNNKFYIIQVNKEKKSNICFTRWGRVGEDGQHNIAYCTDIEAAISSFKKKFKDKTKNDWDKREDFTARPGKYTMIEIDEASDDDADEDTVDAGGVGPGLKKELADFSGPCDLDHRTQIMIKLIFSEDMFVGQMSVMNLDVRKMPLGKLSKLQIAKGLEALIDIEEAIKQNKPRQTLMDLTSKFYTMVPHDFGRTVPPVLDTDSVVQQKKEVMLTLSDIELTQSLQKDKANAAIHPLLEKYQMLDCELEVIGKNTSEFKLLKEYATSCPDTRKGPLLDVWRVDRKGAKERFSTHEDLENRKLLWHGTNVAVVAAILKAGLRIMPHSGGLVGKGIYFASEHSKSSWYVRSHWQKFEGEENVGFMFLVEVALGIESSVTQCDGTLTKAPEGYHSVVARGQKEPDPKKNKKLDLEGNDVVVPVGKPVPQKKWAKSGFCQSEYLVYKESQARIRYMLKFSFK